MVERNNYSSMENTRTFKLEVDLVSMFNEIGPVRDLLEDF